jgi:hypothetical protein
MARFSPYDLELGLSLDQQSVALFRLWSAGEICDVRYGQALAPLLEQSRACPVIHANMMNRLDAKNGGTGRSLGQMACQIGRQSRFEARDTLRWFNTVLDADHKDIAYHGMDSAGAIYFSPKRVSGKADWKIATHGSSLLPSGVHLVETKHNPARSKFSLKIDDLIRYAREGAWILAFFGKYDGGGEPPLRWVLIPPETVADLTRRPTAIYPEFAPNKEAIRLSGEELDAFIASLPNGWI